MLYVGDNKYKMYVGSQMLKPVVKSLPYDAEVEYLESDGRAYIDTGIYGSMDLDFYIKFKPNNLPTATGKGSGTIFGARTAWNSNLYQLTTFTRNMNSIGTFSWANLGWDNQGNKTLSLSYNDCTISKIGNVFTDASGTSSNMTSYSFTTAYKIYLFALNQKDIIQEISTIRLYNITFSRSGTKILELIPVRKDNIGYLYDKVSGQLFGNANSEGAFIYGNDIN